MRSARRVVSQDGQSRGIDNRGIGDLQGARCANAHAQTHIYTHTHTHTKSYTSYELYLAHPVRLCGGNKLARA